MSFESLILKHNRIWVKNMLCQDVENKSCTALLNSFSQGKSAIACHQRKHICKHCSTNIQSCPQHLHCKRHNFARPNGRIVGLIYSPEPTYTCIIGHINKDCILKTSGAMALVAIAKVQMRQRCVWALRERLVAI